VGGTISYAYVAIADYSWPRNAHQRAAVMEIGRNSEQRRASQTASWLSRSPSPPTSSSTPHGASGLDGTGNWFTWIHWHTNQSIITRPHTLLPLLSLSHFQYLHELSRAARNHVLFTTKKYKNNQTKTPQWRLTNVQTANGPFNGDKLTVINYRTYVAQNWSQWHEATFFSWILNILFNLYLNGKNYNSRLIKF